MPGQPAPRDKPFLPLLLGIALTLTTRGYDFASGNHAIYLVAPLREAYPHLLANDWWTTHTLQYHLVFTKVSAWLIRTDLIAPAFLFIQLALIAALHIAWLRIVRALGWGTREYLLSVVFYSLSAAGLSLGAYRFIQEASVLPANIANIAMLWGILYWIQAKHWPAALFLGIAGLFHLNHAIIAAAFWTLTPRVAWVRPQGLTPVLPLDTSSPTKPSLHRLLPQAGGLFLILTLSLPNILPAARAILTPHASMPLKEFVDLYVKLRHPHHYDPLSWPIALWISFCWPIALIAVLRLRAHWGAAVPPASALCPLSSIPGAAGTAAPQVALRLSTPEPRRRALFVFTFFMLLLIIAFLFAGLFFISEPLIQMSLFRFSIYPKLLSCIAAAGLLLNQQGHAKRATRILLIALIVLINATLGLCLIGALGPAATRFAMDNVMPLGASLFLLVGAAQWVLFADSEHRTHQRFARFFASLALLASLALCISDRRIAGLHLAVQDLTDPDYLALCHWSRDHTPIDSIFLVPPAEQHMRYQGQRAIVINFKGVPQLSSELGEWRDRLQAIIDMPLENLPHRFDLIHAALSRRYDELSVTHLASVARQYQARYLVLSKNRQDPAAPAGARIVFENPRYQLYDLTP